MIIWQGYGLLAAVYAVIGFVFGAVFTGEDNAVWPVAIGLLLAAAANYFTAKKLASNTKTLIDPENGQEVILKKAHSLFFIPMMYWTYIMAAFALVLLFAPG